MELISIYSYVETMIVDIICWIKYILLMIVIARIIVAKYLDI